MRRPTLFFGILSTLAAANFTSAATTQERPDSLPTYLLEGITISTRAPVELERVPQRIDVLSREELRTVPASNVGEALRRTTTIDAIEFPGLLMGVSIRGFRPQYTGVNPRTLILVNGRPAGTSNLALLHLNDVERIEVLRGPASALYGASAMGGVVNVITRRSSGRSVTRLQSEYDSSGSYENFLAIGGGIGRGVDFDVGLTVEGRRSGYETGSNRAFGGDSLLMTLPDGSSVRLPLVGADTSIAFSEYASQSASGRLGFAFTPDWRLDLSAEGYRGYDVENPGDLNVVAYDSRSLKDVDRWSADAIVTGNVAGAVATLRAYSTNETVDYFDTPEAPNYVNFRTPTSTYGAQLQGVVDVGGQQVTLGLDRTASVSESERFTENGEGLAPFNPNTAIRSIAAFGQAQVSLLEDRVIVVGGGRLDRVTFEVRETPNLGGVLPNTERHVVFTPSAGLVFFPAESIRFHGSVGRAFITPEAFSVAGYSEMRPGERRAVRITQGNPELDPETSWTWDAGAGIATPGRGVVADLTYFSTDVRDRITTQTTTPATPTLTAAGDSILFTTTYLNVDDATIRGIEADFSYQPGWLAGTLPGARLFARGTRILEAVETFSATGVTRRIKNVAKMTVVAGIEYDGGGFDARLSGRYVGDRVDADYVDFSPGEILYPEYLVVDLSAGVSLLERFRLGLELRNLGDEDYFEVRGYNLPGRSIGITASMEL